MSNNVIVLSDSTVPGSEVGIFGGATVLTANAKGYITFSMSIPSVNTRRFTTGTKEVKVTDSPNNNPEDETSFARTFFVSSGLNQTKQRTII